MPRNKYVKLLDEHRLRCDVLREFLLRDNFRAASRCIPDNIRVLEDQLAILKLMDLMLKEDIV